MNPDEYQQDALRTESLPSRLLTNSDQADALDSLMVEVMRLGRAADVLKKHLFYGREADLYKMLEVDLERHEPDTELDLETVNRDTRKVRLIHAFLGFLSELEEIAEPLQAHVFQGEPLDEVNMMEEGGDQMWYQGIYQNALGFKMSEAMRRNIAKLAERFVDLEFTCLGANVRDLEAERRELEGKGRSSENSNGTPPQAELPGR